MDAQAEVPAHEKRDLLLPLMEMGPDLPAKSERQMAAVPVGIKMPTGIGHQRSGPGQLSGQPEDFALMKVAVEGIQTNPSWDGEAFASTRSGSSLPTTPAPPISWRVSVLYDFRDRARGPA